jgi:hypothetical protein
VKPFSSRPSHQPRASAALGLLVGSHVPMRAGLCKILGMNLREFHILGTSVNKRGAVINTA